MSLETNTKDEASGSFRHSVLVLLGGTAFAHVITALALPIATRLYSPDAFSVLAVYSSVVYLVSVAACLRFDIAVSIADSDEEAANLLVLALSAALSVSALIGVALALFPSRMHESLGLATISHYLWWLPPGMFLAATYGALQGWFVRRSNFGLISRSRVAQSATAAGGQIGFGLAGVTPQGLLIGFVLNIAVGCAALGYRLVSREAHLFTLVRLHTLQATFHAFIRYPKYSTLEALSNSAALQLPIIMIATLAVGPEAGFLTLAMSVMQAPMSLIGNAIGQVYLSRAPEAHRKGNLGSFTLDTLDKLCKVGVGPLIFAGIVAPGAFAVIFGDDWRRAGEMVTWMTPWFVTQFLTSPLSMAVHVTGHQRLAMALQIFGVILRVFAVWGMSFVAETRIVEAYALSGFLFYSIYFLIILTTVKAPLFSTAKRLSRHLASVSGWAGGALLILWLNSTFNPVQAVIPK